MPNIYSVFIFGFRVCILKAEELNYATQYLSKILISALKDLLLAKFI